MRWLFCTLIAAMAPRCGTPPPRAVPVVEDGPLGLTLMSFNIRYENPEENDWRAWPNRIRRVVKSLRQIDPDVFGVQECMHGQAADLRASLPDYDFFGVGREDGRRGGEYAAIFYRRERFERTDGGHFWLSDTPEVAGSRHWGNGYPRMTTWVRLVDRSTGRGFRVFNTHWDHRNQYSREKAAPLIARRMASHTDPEEPVILLGDFNATEGNPAVDYFIGKPVTLAGAKQAPLNPPLIDPYQTLHAAVRDRRTLHFWQGHRTGWAKVDHILVSQGAIAEAADIRVEKSREEQPSDHFPVWARVRWP